MRNLAKQINRQISIPKTMLFFIVITISLSCKTMPNISESHLEDAGHAPLDKGALVYLFADVKEARSIINLLPIDELKDRQVRQLLDRTDFIAAALFLQESGRKFQLTAWGKYPSGASIVFSANKNWKKMRSRDGRSYWHSSQDKLSLALNSKNAFASAWLNDSPESPFVYESGVEIPEGFNDFRGEKKDRNGNRVFPKAPLSCWLDDPGSAILRILNNTDIPVNIPVKKIFFCIYAEDTADDQYKTRIMFQFENAIQARAAAAILNLAGGYLSGGGVPAFVSSVFFSNPMILEGRSIEFISSALSGDELAFILNFFLGGK